MRSLVEVLTPQLYPQIRQLLTHYMQLPASKELLSRIRITLERATAIGTIPSDSRLAAAWSKGEIPLGGGSAVVSARPTSLGEVSGEYRDLVYLFASPESFDLACILDELQCKLERGRADRVAPGQGVSAAPA